MNLQALLSEEIPAAKSYHQVPMNNTPYHSGIGALATPKNSPSADAKDVNFQLCNQQYSDYLQKREPPSFKVTINPHDSTESIASTVKSYFGLLANDAGNMGSYRVSFEDKYGTCLILSHENVMDGMTVFVRAVFEEAPRAYRYQPNVEHQYTDQDYEYDEQASYRERSHYTGRNRSASPENARQRRSGSATSSGNGRSRSVRQYGSGTPTPDSGIDLKTKLEPLASSDISLDNVLEGSRRKRLKFESSELPLFPELATRVPADSSSSASPNRITPQITPYSQQQFYQPNRIQNPPQSAYLYSLGSELLPPANGMPSSRAGLPTPAPTIASCISDEDVAIQLMRLGETPSAHITSPSYSNGYQHQGYEYSADEGSPDVRDNYASLVVQSQEHLGYSTATAAMPHHHQHQHQANLPSYDTTDPSDDGDDDDNRDGTYMGTSDPLEEEDDDKPLIAKRAILAPARNAPPPPATAGKKRKVSDSLKPKANNGVRKTVAKLKASAHMQSQPAQFKLAPANLMMPPSNKPFASAGEYGLVTPPAMQHQPFPVQANGLDPQHPQEPIEYQKPRCQRCRKSKKGCDRQRPCQRCKDAGIPADQCISEDEAGTRRGRANAAKAAGGTKVKGPPKPKKRKLSV